MLGRLGRGLGRIFASPRPTLGSLDYDTYWDQRPADVFQPRFEIIAQLLPTGAEVADIGCGDGSLLRYLERRRNVAGFGVDISTTAVEVAQRLGTNASVADVTDPGFSLPRRVDYVVLSEVLEHIADPEAVLIGLRASTGRFAIVTLPNTGYIEHRLRLLFGRFPVQWLFHPGEHLRFWTIADFRMTAGATGYDVTRIQPALGWFPLARLWPSLFASQLVYVLSPGPERP